MTWVDRTLARWRFRLAAPHIPAGARLLDIGAHQGELLAWLGARIAPSVGIEPALSSDLTAGDHMLLAGVFPERTADGEFDAATLLAVVEHLDDATLASAGVALSRQVRPGGPVVVTVPSPAVDGILRVLRALRLVDGIDAEAHHGFDPGDLPARWAPCGLRLRSRTRFQLGLNNLFVFEVTEPSAAPVPGTTAEPGEAPAPAEPPSPGPRPRRLC